MATALVHIPVVSFFWAQKFLGFINIKLKGCSLLSNHMTNKICVWDNYIVTTGMFCWGIIIAGDYECYCVNVKDVDCQCEGC